MILTDAVFDDQYGNFIRIHHNNKCDAIQVLQDLVRTLSEYDEKERTRISSIAITFDK